MTKKLSRNYDIAIIGGGLSAATMIYHFIHELQDSVMDKEYINVIVFDKHENFWTGVPYGNMSESDFFLIETLAQTDCNLFSEWIYKNIENIPSWLKANCQMLQLWYKNNKIKIECFQLDEIYFPRYFFGLFIIDLLDKIIKKSNFINIDLINEEIIDVIEDNQSWILKFKSNNFINTSSVVLAIGSSPKKFNFSTSNEVLNKNRYISDNDICSVFNLRKKLPLCFFEKNLKSHVLIIGAGASSLETIYYMTTRSDIFNQVDKITVVSTSGMLIGGFYANDFDESELPPYVTLRTSCDMYINAAKELHRKGMLNIVKGKVYNLDYIDDQFCLSFKKDELSINSNFSVTADIVINCCGSGSLYNTNSTLIKRLVDRLPVNEEGRGFLVDNNNQIIGHSNFYVLGPLLNSSFSGRQVESIKAVFREGHKVGSRLAEHHSLITSNQPRNYVI